MKGIIMKKYFIKANPLTGDKDIEITRNEIVNMKKKINAGGYSTYSMMLNVLSPKVAITRACIVPGTRVLVWGLNLCIIFGRILIIALIVLLIKQKWWLSLAVAILDYLIIFRIQTAVNYEIGARLFVLDQYLQFDDMVEKKQEC